MPVPPQESAPSLSPRQSFGCQSPLPWVAGTDRTRILWALWQLQGFLPGVLFSLCALSHLEELLHRPTSLTQSSTAWSQQSMQNTDKCFPKWFSCHRIISGMISEQRLHAQASSAFPKQLGILPLKFNIGFRYRKCAHGISQRQTRTHSSRQECTRSPPDQTQAFPASRDKPGYSGRWRTSSTHRGLGSNGGRFPTHGSARRLYFHAPGLTLVTLGTACVPSVRPSPTTWEIMGPSKGLRLK
jgi:hypothetical protein